MSICLGIQCPWQTTYRIESDLSSVINYAEDVIKTLQSLRKSNEKGQAIDIETFFKLYKKAETLLKDRFGIEVTVPRQSICQTQRENVLYSTPEEYHFHPCVDTMISGLTNRFRAKKSHS